LSTLELQHSEAFQSEIPQEPIRADVSGRIFITSQQDWDDLISAGKCIGLGIEANPYIIYDLIIDGENSFSAIHITTRDKYYRIENCVIFNATQGIRLFYPTRATIRYCNLSGFDTGLYVDGDWQSESEVIVNNNTFSNNNNFGIEFYQVYKGEIYNNNFTNNQDYAIKSGNSNNLTFYNNNFARTFDDDEDAVYISYGLHCDFYDNTFIEADIWYYDVASSNISGNEFYRCDVSLDHGSKWVHGYNNYFNDGSFWFTWSS
ncbi:unnamed protein product, partial [marine sediment metagenome]